MTTKFLYSVIRFVPDPARGEFVNVGAVVGSDETADWSFRMVDNLARARKLDDAGVLPHAVSFIDQAVGARIDAFQAALESAGALSPGPQHEVDHRWLGGLYESCQNVVQFSSPAPLAADSADAALELVFEELLLDPQTRKFPFKKKTTAVAAVRKSYLDRGLKKGHDFFERQTVHGAHHHESFDFVLANGKVKQLAQAWSFQVPDQDGLAESVKAWAWTVKDLREHGGAAAAPGRGEIEVPKDVDIKVVFVAPKHGKAGAVLDEAKSVFAELKVQTRELDGSGPLNL